MRAALNTHLYLSPSPCPGMGGSSYVSGMRAMIPCRNSLVAIVADMQTARFADCASQFCNGRR